ncbi:hypothetical protein GGR38_003795 [Novosphingobium sediminicola]|uniref:Uncharacterized protein n=1 Tax=Novosphingobium sediminicola TaxID=563162 RepID=A0A7W6G7E7_9SPHN|nr:hypothetical protein [Novosphingobium sediminicola]
MGGLALASGQQDRDDAVGHGRYALGMAVGFLGLLLVLLCLPFDRYLASQRAADSEMFHARWIYERLHFDPTPVDVAIIGSSRVEAGISSDLMARILSAKFHRQIHVVNLALVKPGRDYHDLLVRDLLATHPEVRMIILSDDGFMIDTHPMFQEMASVAQIASAPILINKSYFANLLAVPYRNLLNGAQQLLPGWFGVDTVFRPDNYLGSDLDRTLGYRLPSGHKRNGELVMPPKQLLARAQATIAERGKFRLLHMSILPEAWQLSIDHTYMESIAGLARDHHVALAFIGLPMFGPRDEPRNPAYFSRFGPDFLPVHLRNDPRFYQDEVHLNRAGAIAATQYLADKVAPLLSRVGV